MAETGIPAVFSYAGRTHAPRAQPIPTRVGGFGGAAGLARYMQAEHITHLIDATHPFAAQMSRNAVEAAAQADVPVLAFERPAWEPQPKDRWISVADIPAAVAALPTAPARIFLAIGRQHLVDFAERPEHHYLLRLVDAPERLPLPGADVIIATGPFSEAGDRALLQRHGIDLIVAKNAGGVGARAKLDAARALGLPVILINRPMAPDRPVAGTVEQVMAWLQGRHVLLRGV